MQIQFEAKEKSPPSNSHSSSPVVSLSEFNRDDFQSNFN